MAGQEVATILHADLDSFYASVEQSLDPTLFGRAMAVGGGVILSASYEARRFGVQGGMATSRAMALCPSLLLLPPRFPEYRRMGDAFVELLYDFTPNLERISIDEAFLDVAGAIHLFGPPEQIATEIRRRTKEELGLAVSVGVARTKHLAKIASQVAKPDGLLVVAPGTELDFLHPLPVGLLWGVGPAMRSRLERAGVRSVGDLAGLSEQRLASLVGAAQARHLSSLAVDSDPRVVESSPRDAISVGAQRALGSSRLDRIAFRSEVGRLADQVAARLREKGRAARRVTVRLRFYDMTSVTRSHTLARASASTSEITKVAQELAQRAMGPRGSASVNLVAVSTSGLVADEGIQESLPFDDQSGKRREVRPHPSLDRSIDRVRARFGTGSVSLGPALLEGATTSDATSGGPRHNATRQAIPERGGNWRREGRG